MIHKILIMIIILTKIPVSSDMSSEHEIIKSNLKTTKNDTIFAN